MAIVRKAHAKWEGDLISGHGNVGFEAGSLPEVPVTWKARTEVADGKTSPEELLAGAHAACFAMAFSNGLAKAGHPAKWLKTHASCTFDKIPEGWRVTKMELQVTGNVPGISASEFETLAKSTGEKGCPISVLVGASVPISVSAKLE